MRMSLAATGHDYESIVAGFHEFVLGGFSEVLVFSHIAQSVAMLKP